MSKIVPVDKEYTPDEGVMICEMDLSGIITFANRKFYEASAYEIGELVGKNHSIVNHPSVPEHLFSKMWQALKDSQTWNAIVKNIRKDGYYYWTEAEVMPLYDKDNRVKGYMSAKRAASRKNIQETEELYKKMLKA